MRLHGGVVAVGLAILACAPAAQAAQRYASVGGEGTACSQGAPCSLKTAVTKAKTGDEVIIGAGSYAVPELLVPEGTSVYIHGDLAGPMPQIVGSDSSSTIGTGFGSTLAHLDMSNTATDGWGAYCGEGATLERIRATAFGMSGIGIFMPGDDCTVRDSVARATGASSSAILGYGGAGTRTFTVRNVTAIASGPSSRGIVSECLICLPGESANVEVTNAIVDGTATDLVASGTGKILVESSNFETSKGSAESIVDESGNQKAPPLFVDAAAGDYRQAVGSPTIDAGVADPANGPTDVAGNPRTIGPAPDIGAFEHIPPAPVAARPAPGRIRLLRISPRRLRPGNVGGAVVSAARKGRKRAPVGTKVAYALSAAAIVRFSVERKLAGRRVGGKCRKATRVNRRNRRCVRFKRAKGRFSHAGAAGANRFRFSGRIRGRALRPGAYRLLGRAGGATRRASFRIVR